MRQLGTGTAIKATIPAESIVEAGPVTVSDTERWYPVARFQTVSAGQAGLQFIYQHQFLVSVAKWSSGPSPLGVVMGDVSRNDVGVPVGAAIGTPTAQRDHGAKRIAD